MYTRTAMRYRSHMAGSRCQSIFLTSCFSSGVPLVYDGAPICFTVDNASFSGVLEATCSGLAIFKTLRCFRRQCKKSGAEKISSRLSLLFKGRIRKKNRCQI